MVEQRDDAWVKSASPEAVHAALNAGELVQVLGGKTPAELDHAAHVAFTPKRLLAEAYKFESHEQLVSVSNHYGSTMLAAKRADMSPAQLEKLNWVESATPADVYAAEQAGDLDSLLGRDVVNEATRIAAIQQRLRDAVGGVGH
ncbi:hypothetical protein [Leifsonia sp. SIMBA_070]|uniref:hypothetical protein n=1 Tax=Leifsonia sp. SIMBA_070 TaxID=3085810 RepID=UPI00397A116F